MTHPKVDEVMVEKIKRLRGEGMTQEEIAVQVGLSQGIVSLILRAQGLGGQLVKVKRRKFY